MHKGQPDWLGKILVPVTLKIALGVYVACVVISCFATPVGSFDDAIPLVHAMLIQQGRTPNLDFYSFYPPLGLYVTAAAFGLFGRSVVAARAIEVLLYLWVLSVAARFFRSRFPDARPLVPAAVLLVAASIGSTITWAPWPGFAVSMAALLIYLDWLCGESTHIGVVVTSGFLAGFAMLWRVNFGGYVAIVVAINLLVQWWFRGEARWEWRHFKSDLGIAAAFAIPLMVCWIGFCFWAYGRNAGVAVTQFVITAQQHMAAAGFIELRLSRDVAFAVTLAPAWFLFRILQGAEAVSVKALVPATCAVAFFSLTVLGGTHLSVILLVAALELAAVVALHIFVRPLERCEFCVLLFFCGLLHYFLVRADWDHERLLPAGAAMLLPFALFSRFRPTDPEGESLVSKGTALMVLAVAIFYFVTSADYRPTADHVRTGIKILASVAVHPGMTDTDRVLGPTSPGEAWESVYPDVDELHALRYVRARTRSTEPIFVGVQDHSRVFVNNLRIYWLADRPIGVRMFQLEYKVATEAPFQRETISDLERYHVQWLIIENTRVKEYSQGSNLLDEYIARNFRVEARFGRFAVLSAVVAKEGARTPVRRAVDGMTDAEAGLHSGMP
jgi:hypothetical protein